MCCGWIGSDYQEVVHKMITPYCNPMKMFASWLYNLQSLLQPKQKVEIWTFNGLKYEMKFLIHHLVRFFKVVRPMGELSSMKALKVSDNITIYDARTLYPSGSLASISGQVNTHFIKAQFDIGKISSYSSWRSSEKDVLKYCVMDCLATM